MFIALEQPETTRLRSLGFAMLDRNKPAALLCLDYSFIDVNGLLKGSKDDVFSTLQSFHSYCQLLLEITFHKSPWTSPSIRHLFSLPTHPEGRLALLPGTFLHQCYERYRARAGVEAEVPIDHLDFLRLYRFSLTTQLRERIESVYDQCLRLQIFEPCQTRFVTGRCHDHDCPREHVLDSTWYNGRLRFYFRQALMLQIHRNLPNTNPKMRQRRIRYCRSFSIDDRSYLTSLFTDSIWIERLYESLNPIHHAYGSQANFAISLVPEAKRGLGATKEWVRETLYKLDPYNPVETFVTTFVRLLSLGSSFDYTAASGYVHQVRCVQLYKPPSLVRTGNVYIINDVIGFFKGAEPWSLNAGVLFLRYGVLG